MLGFTGEHDGLPVSVMGTGMGIPSMSIYATELVRFYDVRRLIRVGSCGGVAHRVALRDVLIATGAATDSGVNRRRYRGWDYAATADFHLARAAVDAAAALGIPATVGVVHSADLFYPPGDDDVAVMDAMGVLAVEMEAAGLYGVAAEHGARALAILTVSDHLRTGEAVSSQDRERTLDEMVDVALEALHRDAWDPGDPAVRSE
jgi:purine-nucleoside phosphorylase